MKSDDNQRKLGRRDFFKKAGVTVGIAGAAAASLAGATKGEAAVKPPKSAGYRESEHVRTYYELARF